MGMRHAIVTGGGSGVGAQIAVALAEAGHAVTITGRRAAALKDSAKRHTAIGWAACDVTDATSVAEAFDSARDRNGPVDIVVANAGAADSAPFAQMRAEDLTRSLSVNLTGVFNAWQAAFGNMKSAGWGRMIAIASAAGLKGYPYVAGYCAAKHGVVGLTRSLALELARTGITVNAVCPGFTETPLLERSITTIMEKTGMTAEEAANSLKKSNPQGRFVQPAEIAAAVVWLCSDESASINGTVLPIAGGEV